MLYYSVLKELGIRSLLSEDWMIFQASMGEANGKGDFVLGFHEDNFGLGYLYNMN